MALPNIIQQINSKLPLSGGTITGSITFLNNWGDNVGDIGGCISTNNNCLRLTGGEFAFDNAGGVIQLFNRLHTTYAGGVVIRADNGTNSNEINLKPDGTFTWGGNNVITSAGGNFNGAIHFKNGGYISRCYSTEVSSGASELSISALSNGNDPYTGASIYLHDINDTRGNTQGGFFIYARNTKEKECGLCGYTDGTLTWNNKNVVCVTKYSSGNNWYRKYADGFIEQGGFVSASASTLADRNFTISLITSFTTTAYSFSNIIVLTAATENWGAGACALKSKSTTSVVVIGEGAGGASPVTGIWWYACGY